MEYKVIEGQLFMDVIYGPSQQKLDELVADWGHKEQPKHVYAIVDNDEYNEFNETGEIVSYNKYLSSNKQHIMEELAEMNE
jgi:hypothetical protein